MKRKALFATLAVACGTLLQAAALSAQKALVYCPVGIDVTGCSNAVTALGGAFPDGVDRGYDGSAGTVSLADADLWQYAVVVVPSLSDNAYRQPYALLRQPAVAERMRGAVLGRVAIWSGTPDQGSVSREQKDVLLRSLATWAAGNHTVVRGPGLVALADVSESATERYGWLRAITGKNVIAYVWMQSYSSVRALSATGTAIVGSLAYANMATYGLQLANGASGVSLDAVGRTGSGSDGQVVLMTTPGGNTGAAVVRTDRDYYPPGDTVVITGSGFQPGETVVLTLHEDPQLHGNRSFTTIADALGNLVFGGFAPEEHDVDVRFVLTAAGQSSGLQAQTTFKDAAQALLLSPASGPAGTSVVITGAGLGTSTTYTVIFGSATFTVGTADGSTLNPVTAPPGTGTVSVVVMEGGSTMGTLAYTYAADAAPSLSNVPAFAIIPELSSYTFDADATDPGAPPQTLVFSLVGAPSGAAIDPTTGVFTWTPTEVQGNGGTYSFRVRVSDGTTNTDRSVALTVSEVNQAPVWTTIGPKSALEEWLLSFTVSATDGDVPQTLTYSVVGSLPDGASFDPATRNFRWYPNETQGGGSFTITLRVSDGTAYADETFVVTVGEVHANPSLRMPISATIKELVPYGFDAGASDTDIPAQTLTFSLWDNAPAGATIEPSTGVFSWTPDEAQGPGIYIFYVKVSDGFVSTSQKITLTVTEVNQAPVWTAVGGKSVDEGSPLSFTVSASDGDQPANTLRYSVVGALPSGAAFDSVTRTFSWTPTEAQDGSHPVTLRVSDGTASADESVTIDVAEVNQAPLLAALTDRTLNELTTLAGVAAAGSDADLVGGAAQALSHSLTVAPVGMTIDASTGAISWTPGESQDGTHDVTVRASDGSLAASGSFRVTVNEVNTPPVWTPVGNRSVDEGSPLSFTVSAADGDLPAQTVTYSALSLPAGASFDPATRTFSWTPTRAQGPGSYFVTLRASDEAASTDESFSVTVADVNSAPVLAAIGDRSVDEEAALGFGVSATDPDLPANGLFYSLVGAPPGASIDPATGAFGWTPAEAQGPGSYTFRVRVTDDGAPALSDEEEITVTVAEVNRAPGLAAIPDQTVAEGGTLRFTAGGTDPDLPANTLTYTLVGSVPAGAGIDPATGVFTWSPTDDGPTATPADTHAFTVRVGDGALSAERSFTVTVSNVVPTLTGASADPLVPVAVGSPIRVAATFTDPAGSADSYRLRVTWDTGTTPVEYPGYTSGGQVSRTDLPPGVYTVTVQVLDDDGGLSAPQTITQYVVVYDPSGGFVTGRGWIDSPAGACRLATCTAATAGRASFGFTSRYQKGQTRPSGSTEFQIQAGDLNFRSTLYDWLVTAGARAQYKGEGTINGGLAVYGFLLTAVDGQVSGGGGTDKFRIKIWEKATGHVVYDNQMGQAEDSDAATVLGGGSIMIQGG